MKFARAAILILLALAPVSAVAATPVPKMEWYQCQETSDCVFTHGMCTDNEVVNKKYLDDYTKYLVAQKMKCNKFEERLPNITAGCMDGKCVMNLPYTLKDALPTPTDPPKQK